jgi:hypothetical protein
MKPRPADFTAGSYAVGPRLAMGKPDPDNGFREGIYWSRDGIVVVWLSPRTPSTMLILVRAGRVHTRQWRHVWPDRTVARLAREFSAAIARGGA